MMPLSCTLLHKLSIKNKITLSQSLHEKGKKQKQIPNLMVGEFVYSLVRLDGLSQKLMVYMQSVKCENIYF